MRAAIGVLALVAGMAQAEGIIQCRGADGKLSFSDKPCAAGQAGKAVQLSAPAATYDSGEVADRLQRSQQEIGLRRDMERAAEAVRAQREATVPVDAVACANAERMHNYYGRSTGVYTELVKRPGGGTRTQEVINLREKERYDEYRRACGKGAGER